MVANLVRQIKESVSHKRLSNRSYNIENKQRLVPQLQLRFDQIGRLPRKEQEFVIRFIDTVLEKAQKA